MSIVVLEKPMPKISKPDWLNKISELKEISDVLMSKNFKLLNDSHKLRNNTDITLCWNTEHTNKSIVESQTQLLKWKNSIQEYYKKLEKEVTILKSEKNLSERILEFLHINFSVINHCMSIRDERGGSDLCYDIADIELKNEKNMLESMKKELTEKCYVAWEQICNLENLCIKVAEDIENKNRSITINSELFKDLKHISLKPDPLRIPNDFIEYEMWLQLCNNLKLKIETELNYSKMLRETMYVFREKIKNDIRAQNDEVNLTLRAKIFETEKLKNELYWQKLKMEGEKEKLLKEIENLEIAVDSKLYLKQLAETKCEQKLYRISSERCIDKTTHELHKEIFELNYTTRLLTAKLQKTREMFHILTRHINLIDEELKNKTHALSTEQKCLQYRSTHLQEQR
ncbi:tektin-2-like [Daktulosphaira vitifoliae]|uniref:tektin-2-like n=1 Tax=Daktulosphaira vitifoliae TaxID=58002 RepID=UPI0021AAB540|nr:tektin-2-like [Daktulosphaira vitifoliae]